MDAGISIPRAGAGVVRGGGIGRCFTNRACVHPADQSHLLLSGFEPLYR